MRSKPVSVRGNRREKYLALLRGEGEERMSWARAHMCSNRERLMFRRRCEECLPLGLHELLLLSLQNKSPALPKNLGQKSQGNKPLLTPAHVSKPRTQQHSSLAETCGSKKWEKIITELLLVWGALPASLGGPRQFPTSQGSTHFSHIIAAWGPCGESLVALEEPLIMSAHKASSGSP